MFDMFRLILIFLITPTLVLAGSMNLIGEKGKLAEIDKIIEVKMYDNYFLPKSINIKRGETVKFVVHNYGDLVHEFNIATKKMHLEHQKEMMKMIEHGILLGDRIDKVKMKKVAKKDHSMSHTHSNSILLEPNKSGEIIWKFSTDVALEAACNVPGHYEAGMISKINSL